jgi:predicted GTPase
MASEEISPPVSPRRGSHLASIIMELQKKQIVESALSPIKAEPTRISTGAEVVVAVMGVTGVGKSSFIKRVTGDGRVEVGGGLKSGTLKIAFIFNKSAGN